MRECGKYVQKCGIAVPNQGLFSLPNQRFTTFTKHTAQKGELPITNSTGFFSKGKPFWVTSVVPPRSIFYPVPKLITYFQGTELSSFFPSSAFYIYQLLHYCLTSMQTLVSLSCERTGTRQRKGTSNIPEAFAFTTLQGYPILFALPYRRAPFSPHSFPFCQPCLCYKSWWAGDIDPRSNISWLLQHQSMMPSRNTAASRDPAPWDASLCSWAARVPPLHKETGLY